MKLILAIVNNDDSALVSSALTKEGFMVTKLSTTGGFLMVGNTTLLIGSEEKDVPLAKKIIKEHSQTRTKTVATMESLGKGLKVDDKPTEVDVRGATVFVLGVDSMEKY